jgi:hypothetical protein
LPELAEIYNENKSSIGMLAISLDDSVEPTRAVVKETGVTFPVLMGGMSLIEPYEVGPIPRTLILDAEGIIREDYTGLRPKAWIVDALKKASMKPGGEARAAR